jgi:ATP-dependent protease ClpP protease subunit
MALADPDTTPSSLIQSMAHIQLSGSVDESMLQSFLAQLANVPAGDEPIVVELMTLGGGAEIGRRLSLEVGIARERLGRRMVFLGKTVVYSAGVTFMSGFAKADRFLSRDAILLIHSRRMDMTVELSGSLRTSAMRLKEIGSEIENGLRLEEEGFADLIRDSSVTMAEVMERAPTNWYVTAAEAAAFGIVAAVV